MTAYLRRHDFTGRLTRIDSGLEFDGDPAACRDLSIAASSLTSVAFPQRLPDRLVVVVG